MNINLKNWILASRPKTLLVSIGPILIGSSLAYKEEKFNVIVTILALFTSLLIQIATNFVNDYYDFIKGADKADRKGPARGVASGHFSPSIMKRAFIVTFLLALLPGLGLITYGGWPILVIGLASIIAGYLYTGGPFPFAYNGLGDIFVIIFFGPVAVAGTFYCSTLTISWLPIILGLCPGLIAASVLVVNNVRDRVEDKKAGKHTLVVRLGKTFGQIEYIVFIVIAIALPALVALIQSYTFIFFLPSLLISFIVLPSIRNIITYKNATELNKTLGHTARFLLLFSLSFSLGIIFS